MCHSWGNLCSRIAFELQDKIHFFQLFSIYFQLLFTCKRAGLPMESHTSFPTHYFPISLFLYRNVLWILKINWLNSWHHPSKNCSRSHLLWLEVFFWHGLRPISQTIWHIYFCWQYHSVTIQFFSFLLLSNIINNI